MLPKLDERLDEFISTDLDDFIKWDLVVFFHQHPDLADAPKGLATRLGRRQEDVAKALDELVASGVLDRDLRPAGDVYSYVADGPKTEVIEQFIDALDSREHRLQILTKLLRLGART